MTDLLESPVQLHVLRPRGHYIGQVREPYCRKWRTVTGRCRSGQAALAYATLKLKRPGMRARALMLDSSYYHDPIVVGEARYA